MSVYNPTPENIESLMEYASPSGRMLFAATQDSIYDVSAGGQINTADVTGLDSIRFQWVNFSTSGGNFLIACNGDDDVYSYDGSAWANPAITGVSSDTLIYVAQWKSRLWFVERASTNAWYLPVNSIAGAATKLSLGPQFSRGGYLVAIGTVSYDSGTGPDDLIAFVSDQGEVVVYQGTDPSSTTTFALVNRFVIGAPIGRRCLLQVGGDLAVITIDGIVSMISMSNKDRSASNQAAITNKIQDLFNQYARIYRTNFGWQGQIYPLGSYVSFNVPVSSTEYLQLVMNTETGSWCQFEGQNGACWSLFNDEIYFGGGGAVYKADSGSQDNGEPIEFDYQAAFSDFKMRSRKKFFQMIRPYLVTNGSPSLLLTMNIAFSDTEPLGTLNPGSNNSSLWDEALWDVGVWGGESAVYQWFSVGQIDSWGAPRLKGALNGISLQINSFEIKYTVGGVL